jgi:hypothetical protein
LLLCLLLWCKLLLQPSQLTKLRIAAASFRRIPVVAVIQLRLGLQQQSHHV